VRSYLSELQNQGRIQFLVLSDRNIGKGGAWNFIFQGAPGELIAYADSDVYFHPGWLEQSQKLLNAFPKAGMVTARPLRTPEKYYSTTLQWAEQTAAAQATKGEFMAWEDFKQHNESVGVSEQQAQEWFQTSYDWKLEYQGHCAYAGAAHFQFVAPKVVLQSLGSFKMDRPMGQVRSLDEKLNQDGYLRLTTCEALVHHMGNRLVATDAAAEVAAVANRQRNRLANLPLVRRSLMWLYDRIFRLYFETRR
jgi:glycosyltransferase involved in cell wall biosynthesis